MKKTFKLTLVLGAVALLAACGGGGGGGGTSATLAPFTNWSAVIDKEVVAEGISTSGTYAYNLTTERITNRGNQSAPSSGASYTAKYTSEGRLDYAKITSASGEVVSFSRSSGDDFIDEDVIDIAISSDGTKQAFAASPSYTEWEYQSFGIWLTGAGTGAGTFGALSVGAPTANTSIPTNGVANYTGFSMGLHIDNVGNSAFIAASMSADVNFTNRSVVFQTTNSNSVSFDNGSPVANPDLNLNGTLTYQAATNSITGAISSSSGLTGSAAGRFYGPTAQEIGGTFTVDAGSSSLEGYIGAFGGKR